MSVFGDNFLVDSIAILVGVIVILIAYIKWHLNYWQRLGVPTLEKHDLLDVLLKKKSFFEASKETYDGLKAKGIEFGGFYEGINPVFMPISLEMVKAILQKDFIHFPNHGIYFNDKLEPLAGHLFNLEGAKWKNLRAKLTPTFTTGKIKMMFQTIADCAQCFEELLSDSAKNHVAVEMKESLARYSTDVISSCAFGIDCNSIKDPDAEFRKHGRMFFDNKNRNRLDRVILWLLPPQLLYLMGFRTIHRRIERFFMGVVNDAINHRETNRIYRRDFLHLLIQLKNLGKLRDDETLLLSQGDEKGNDSITMNELAAQAFVFFLAGFETSSTVMTFVLYEIVKNTNIQDKMRNEIREILSKHNHNLSYEAVMEMKYLEKVIEETLRKYPPIVRLNRKCTRDYQIPGTSIVIREGTKVAISSAGIQNDPEYYPNPDVFDPERFSEENKAKRSAFAWIPFGEGPRICIGLRFGLIQVKIGLITLVKNFKMSLNEKTKTPITFDKNCFIPSINGGLWLNFEKIQN